MIQNNQKHSSHGGSRKGAGRTPGAATAKTRVIADRAMQEGITPLEVMLKAMRFHVDAFKSSNNPDDLGAAAVFAKDAAPYMHPRLASVEMDAKVTVRTAAEELAELNAYAVATTSSGA